MEEENQRFEETILYKIQNDDGSSRYTFMKLGLIVVALCVPAYIISNYIWPHQTSDLFVLCLASIGAIIAYIGAFLHVFIYNRFGLNTWFKYCLSYSVLAVGISFYLVASQIDLTTAGLGLILASGVPKILDKKKEESI